MYIDRIAVLIRMSEIGIRHQSDLAKKARISRITVAKGMNGGSIAGESVMKIAEVLKVEPSMILVPIDKQVENSVKQAISSFEKLTNNHISESTDITLKAKEEVELKKQIAFLDTQNTSKLIMLFRLIAMTPHAYSDESIELLNNLYEYWYSEPDESSVYNESWFRKGNEAQIKEMLWVNEKQETETDECEVKENSMIPLSFTTANDLEKMNLDIDEDYKKRYQEFFSGTWLGKNEEV